MGDVPVTLTIETSLSKKSRALEAMSRAFDEARRLENAVSEWRPDSDATRLNENAGKALVPIGRDMTNILRKAEEISEATDGAFDITFASPCKGKASPCPYDYRDVLVIPELGLAYLGPGIQIGVSSVAKGYIVDRMSDVLRKAGFRKFLINAGDLYASGRWEIGIRDPDEPSSPEALCTFKVQDRAISTSGHYERGPHIIDPRTRRPASGSKSVTVIAEDSATASSLATGLFVRGPSDSFRVFAAASPVDISGPPHCAPLPFSRSDASRRSWRRNRDNRSGRDTGRP